MIVLTLFAISQVAELPTAPAPRLAVDAVSLVRKAAEAGQVHAVGVLAPEHNRLGELTDWPKLAETLRTKQGPAGRLWELLSKDAQKWLADDEAQKLLSPGNAAQMFGDPNAERASRFKGSVAGSLRKLIDDPDVYSEMAFKGITLTKEVNDFLVLGRKRTALQTARLNWALLETALPGCIPKLPARFRTIRVQVVEGADVVLVLACHTACRWEVTLREGAKVTGVILCGSGPQEVVGVNAPVVYRAYYAPNGLDLAHPDDFFPAPSRKDSKEYEQLAADVKKLTGKELSSFQGEVTPGPFSEPYTIRPGTK